jgi:FkbM family methyltransferase
MSMRGDECHPDPLRIAAYSTCPSGLWHERIAPLLAAPEMVMLNVGANKGYNLVEFLQRYSAAAGNLTHAQWYSRLMELGCKAQCCGVCASCKASRIPQQATAKVHLHAFELQPANAALLQQLVTSASLPVSVHSTAVSNMSGTVQTSVDVKPGSESFGIIRAARRRQGQGVERPVTTLDAFMRSHRVERAHFVSIDTEGEDPLVLHGRDRSLAERRVDVVEFEYNRKWKAVLRNPRPMAPVVEWMHRLGYVCFWQGNKGALAQISGSCYREETRNRFGFARSNAVCSHRADIIAAMRTCQRAPLCTPDV